MMQQVPYLRVHYYYYYFHMSLVQLGFCNGEVGRYVVVRSGGRESPRCLAEECPHWLLYDQGLG
jgi:hypothetical protein